MLHACKNCQLVVKFRFESCAYIGFVIFFFFLCLTQRRVTVRRQRVYPWLLLWTGKRSLSPLLRSALSSLYSSPCSRRWWRWALGWPDQGIVYDEGWSLMHRLGLRLGRSWFHSCFHLSARLQVTRQSSTQTSFFGYLSHNILCCDIYRCMTKNGINRSKFDRPFG